MRKITRVYLEKFLARYATDAKVLDIGSGGSAYGSLFPNRLTVDIDPARDPEIVGDIQALPFPDGSQQFVLCTEVLEHVENPVQAAHELYRVLAPGGVLILTTRFSFPVHDAPGDFWRFTPYGLRRIFREFDIEALETDGGAFSAVAILLQRIGLQSDVRGGKATKALIYGAAALFSKLDWLIERAYGDIGRKNPEPSFLSSGLFLAARKPIR